MNTAQPVHHRSAWLVLALAGLLLPSCSDNKPAAPQASTARVFAADLKGAAAICEAQKLGAPAGQAITTAVKLGNDGGWCAVAVTQTDGQPFATGLLTTRPGHGKVLIHRVGDATRIDYTPDHGFTGADAFVVQLLPGDATIRANVTVAR